MVLYLPLSSRREPATSIALYQQIVKRSLRDDRRSNFMRKPCANHQSCLNGLFNATPPPSLQQHPLTECLISIPNTQSVQVQSGGQSSVPMPYQRVVARR